MGWVTSLNISGWVGCRFLELSEGNGLGPVLSFASVGLLWVCKIGRLQNSDADY